MEVRSRKNILYLLPVLFGFVATITFPDIAIALISYFYGPVSSLGEGLKGGLASFSELSIAFIAIVTFFVCWIFYRAFRMWKGKSYRTHFLKSFLISLSLPIAAYGYVIYDILKPINITTGMYLAVSRSDLIHLKRLMSIGGDPNSIFDHGNGYNYTMLMMASSNGDKEMVRELLRRGADRNVKDSSGKTALDIAREKNHSEVINLLEAVRYIN